MKEIADKLTKYFENKAISQKDIADKMGTSSAYVNAILNNRKEIGKRQAEKMSNLFGFSTSWLLTGEGEMLNSPAAENAAPPAHMEDGVHLPVLDVDYKLVPIIHIDSVGGIHSSNDIIEEPEYIEGYVPFTGARDGDLVIHESGDSMAPTIPAGSLMLIRRVEGWRDFLGYGNIFVLVLRDGRRITKEVTRYDDNPREYVWCVSHNDAVPNEELPKAYIVEVWKVIKWVTNKGW